MANYPTCEPTNGNAVITRETGNIMLTVGSLFSGIGGLELGLERAGMRTIWQVEKDDYCRKVLAKHWPNVPKHEDILDVGKHNLQTADVICGGFPCQPHSVAGKRKASEDERDLWGEFARIICEVRPRWVVAENVTGLLSSEGGRFFGQVLRDLAESGYDAEWNCVSAREFGAAHQRLRVFICAYPSSIRLERRIFERENIGKATLVQDSHRFYVPQRTGHGSRHGLPDFVDRLRSLGNAVVPQVAEYIGRLIVEADKNR